MPMKALQYDISSDGEDRPSDNSNDGEWEPDEVNLNAVTIGNMSIGSKPVATEGELRRYREITVDSGAGESVVNPDDWPNIDLNPSKGSVKGHGHVGPGGEKIDKSGRLDGEVSTGQHNGGENLKSSDTPRSLRLERIFYIARPLCWCGFCEKGCHRGSRTHTAACEKWSVRLANVRI